MNRHPDPDTLRQLWIDATTPDDRYPYYRPEVEAPGVNDSPLRHDEVPTIGEHDEQ